MSIPVPVTGGRLSMQTKAQQQQEHAGRKVFRVWGGRRWACHEFWKTDDAFF